MRIEAGNASCNWSLHLSRHPNYSVEALDQAVNRKRGLEENDTLILLKRNRFDIGKKRGG
jgi:hypothetical protein